MDKNVVRWLFGGVQKGADNFFLRGGGANNWKIKSLNYCSINFIVLDSFLQISFSIIVVLGTSYLFMHQNQLTNRYTLTQNCWQHVCSKVLAHSRLNSGRHQVGTPHIGQRLQGNGCGTQGHWPIAECWPTAGVGVVACSCRDMFNNRVLADSRVVADSRG